MFNNSESTFESAKLDCQQIAIKSFSRKNEIKFAKGYFINEIINNQIINDKLVKCTNEEGKLKLNLFVKFVGFTISENENDLYFGSIITKFYPLGDLSCFLKLNLKKFLKNGEKESPLIKIDQLIIFAEQIAIGKSKL
jgi:hypothetical protein